MKRKCNKFFLGMDLTDLPKVFDCTLLIAKLSAYGLKSELLCYIYFYLKDSKQCVQINNKQSKFDAIIFGLPHDSILSQFYSIFLNDFFFFIPNAAKYTQRTIFSFEIRIKSSNYLALQQQNCSSS